MLKPKPIVLLGALCAVLPAAAENGGVASSTQIPGVIADGSPVQPAPPAALPDFTIQSTTVRSLDVVEAPELPGLPPVSGTITATVHMVDDPGLPRPPLPPATPPALDPETLKRLQEWKETHGETHMVFVSASVFDHSKTLLQWHPNGQPQRTYTAVSNLDYNHFSGFSTYRVKGNDGVVRNYALIMGVGNINTVRTKEFLRKHGKTYQPPTLPEVPDFATHGPAFVIVEGDETDVEAVGVIEDMHLLYRSEGERMAAAYVAREAAYQERKAFLLANPPKPEDVTIHFWKLASESEPPPIMALRSPLSSGDSQPQVSFTKGMSNTWIADWTGVSGRTYFAQWSLDLHTWTFAPFIEHGDGTKSYGGTSTSSKLFFRLKYTDIPTTDPRDDDFDGDKISNWNEVRKGTDPLETSDGDADNMPSDWETYFLLNPNDPLDAALDHDGDGISNLDEFLAGTDPTDYYNGNLPDITTFRGEMAYAEPEQTSILVKEVRRDGVLLANAPVWFERSTLSVAGEFSLTGEPGTFVQRLDAFTGPDGRVTVYVKRGTTTNTVYVNTHAGSAVGTKAISFNNLPTAIRYIFPEGTLGRTVNDAIDDRPAGKDPAVALPIFSTQDHGTATYVRNTACWAYDLAEQMTCLSPWNSRDQARRAGVAITPRHILNAAHYPLEVGDTIRFVTVDDTVVTRTITGKAVHPDYNVSTYYPDAVIYTLDSDLPSTITPCKLPPADFADILKPSPSWRVPTLGLDQEEKALAVDFTGVGVTQRPPGPDEYRAVFGRPVLPQIRAEFHEGRIDGDSGNPAFLIVNDDLVMISVWTQPAQGSSLASHLPALNAMIAAADTQAGVSTGYQIQTADLSGFAPFSPP